MHGVRDHCLNPRILLFAYSPAALSFVSCDHVLAPFHTVPDVIPLSCAIRTSDNVQVKVDMRISFQVFEPELYTKKPVDFYRQISFWVQNELLDAFAQQNFRDFLKHYAASARTVTEASHKIFNEFGLKLLDVQLIHFACVDVATQQLLDRDIITRVTKQNELLAKEADVEIMKREKEVQMQQMGQKRKQKQQKKTKHKQAEKSAMRVAGRCLSLFPLSDFSLLLCCCACLLLLCVSFVCVSDINFEKQIKENTMELKRKELDVSLRMKEVDLQIQEEKKRTELMEIKKQNVGT